MNLPTFTPATFAAVVSGAEVRFAVHGQEPRTMRVVERGRSVVLGAWSGKTETVDLERAEDGTLWATPAGGGATRPVTSIEMRN